MSVQFTPGSLEITRVKRISTRNNTKVRRALGKVGLASGGKFNHLSANQYRDKGVWKAVESLLRKGIVQVEGFEVEVIPFERLTSRYQLPHRKIPTQEYVEQRLCGIDFNDVRNFIKAGQRIASAIAGDLRLAVEENAPGKRQALIQNIFRLQQISRRQMAVARKLSFLTPFVMASDRPNFIAEHCKISPEVIDEYVTLVRALRGRDYEVINEGNLSTIVKCKGFYLRVWGMGTHGVRATEDSPCTHLFSIEQVDFGLTKIRFFEKGGYLNYDWANRSLKHFLKEQER